MAEHKKKLAWFMPYPSETIRKNILEADWTFCVDSWTTLSRLCLCLPPEIFESLLQPEATLVAFLQSYVSNMVLPSEDNNHRKALDAHELRKNVFLVVHRALSATKDSPEKLLHWTFLADLNRLYSKTPSLKPLLQQAWHAHGKSIESSLKSAKDDLISSLDSGKYAILANETFIKRLLNIIYIFPQVGRFLMTGSDLIDSLASSYPNMDTSTRSKAVMLTSLSLSSLLSKEASNASLFTDHLYSLKSISDSTFKGKSKAKPLPPPPHQQQQPPTLLADLCASTPLLSQAQKSIPASSPEAARLRPLLTHLSSLSTTPSFPIPHHKRTRIKRATNTNTKNRHPAQTEKLSVHRMSLVTQLQDLFPHLGSLFLLQLLDALADSIEAATAAVLDDALPTHLQGADRAANLPANAAALDNDVVPGLVPRASPAASGPSPGPPPKPSSSSSPTSSAHISLASQPDPLLDPRNRHRLHFGRRGDSNENDNTTAATPYRPGAADKVDKAAILSALAAFDADDDERDDSYDVADVGGSVDSTVASDVRGGSGGGGGGGATHARPRGEESENENENENEERERRLFEEYIRDKSVFGRDAATRRSDGRRRLRERLGGGVTDESVEGWAIMIEREPRRMRVLERRFAGGDLGGGRGQRELGRSKWSGGDGGDGDGGVEKDNGVGQETQGEAQEPSTSRGFRGRGGTGRQRGGGRGAAAIGTDDAIGRQRKEANKASRANHNRRDQRGRKMARAGGLPG